MGRQRVPFRIETGIQPTREKIALIVAHCEDSSIQAATGGLLSPGGCRLAIYVAVSSVPPFVRHDFSNVEPRFETLTVPNILIL